MVGRPGVPKRLAPPIYEWMNEFYFYVLSLGQQVSKADNTAALIVLYKKKEKFIVVQLIQLILYTKKNEGVVRLDVKLIILSRQGEHGWKGSVFSGWSRGHPRSGHSTYEQGSFHQSMHPENTGKTLPGWQILKPPPSNLSKPPLGMLVGQRPRLSRSLQSTWTRRLPCRGPVIQDLAPFSIWPEQSGRGIHSFQLVGSRCKRLLQG